MNHLQRWLTQLVKAKQWQSGVVSSQCNTGSKLDYNRKERVHDKLSSFKRFKLSLQSELHFFWNVPS